MGLRIALGVALAIVVAGLAIDMSGRAARLADSNHTPAAAFVATVPGGSTACQPIPTLPGDGATATMLIGTYGRPLPRLDLSFVSATGAVAAQGVHAAGGSEGIVQIAFKHVRGGHEASSACLHNGGRSPIALGGYGRAPGPGSERIDGVPAAGAISVTLFRAGRESWWSMLGALDRRFTLGKAGLLGDLTLPLCALLLLGVWVAVVRLLIRETA